MEIESVVPWGPRLLFEVPLDSKPLKINCFLSVQLHWLALINLQMMISGLRRTTKRTLETDVQATTAQMEE